MADLERVVLEGGEVLMAHRKDACFNPGACTIHNPTDHHMRNFRQHWRGDRGFMERICPHGVGHPDPDQMTYIEATRGERVAYYEGIHGCDGCCARPGDGALYDLRVRNYGEVPQEYVSEEPVTVVRSRTGGQVVVPTGNFGRGGSQHHRVQENRIAAKETTVAEPDNHHNALACAYCLDGLAEHDREVAERVISWIEQKWHEEYPDAREHFGVYAPTDAELIACPHWNQGRITMRKGCTACEAEGRKPDDAERADRSALAGEPGGAWDSLSPAREPSRLEMDR
jgi:hypothetical protein